jgi:hypothetical protein
MSRPYCYCGDCPITLPEDYREVIKTDPRTAKKLAEEDNSCTLSSNGSCTKHLCCQIAFLEEQHALKKQHTQ